MEVDTLEGLRVLEHAGQQSQRVGRETKPSLMVCVELGWEDSRCFDADDSKRRRRAGVKIDIY